MGTCSWHGVGNDPTYNSAGVFETFPFPEGLTPDIPAVRYEKDLRAIAISRAAKRLDDLRCVWLDPGDLVQIEPEIAPGYPERVLPKDTASEAILRERTLTHLYNQRPQWLIDAHSDLDAAVAAAYGWPSDISEDELLANLLELNLAREAFDLHGKPSPKTSKPRRLTPQEIRRAPQLKLPIAGDGKSGVAPQQLPTENRENHPQNSKRRAS